MREACGPGAFLPSPAQPLLSPRNSLALFAADYAKTAGDAAGTSTLDWSHMLRSVAEGVCYLPRIEKPGEKGGDGVYVEKTLFDAFLPFNATLSVTLAFLTASTTELTRSGKINDFVTYLAGDDLEDADEANALPPSLPWEWDRVGHDTATNLTKDVLGQTLTRSLEIVSKPRLARPSYCELLKHPHKAACTTYKRALPSSSRMGAASKAATIVARSPTFYAVRAVTCWLSDIFVDAVAWYRGQLGSRQLGSNAALKLLKYALGGGLSLMLGACVPFLYPHPYVFIGVEQLVANLTADAIVASIGTIEPS